MPEVLQYEFYPAVGRCIYCGATEDSTVLTDEHIVARGLGGQLILQKSSCTDCNHVIGAGIEHKCLRHMLGPLRDGLGLAYRRRKKERPKTVPSHVRVGDDWRLLDTPSDMRMDATMIYHFPVPGILLGLSPEEAGQRSVPGIWVASRVKKSTLGWVEAQAPEATEYRVASSGFEPVLFQKMLAKTAHAYAVAELGIDNFAALLPEAIIGKKPWHSTYLVGGFAEGEPLGKGVYEVGMRYGPAADGTPLIGVRVRFFGGMGAPAYLVIVGLPLYTNTALTRYL